jgi:hypothetical protein
VLFHRLVRVEAGEFSFDDSLGSLGGSLEEIVINLGDSATFLHALHKVFRGEALHNLEFLVPVAELFRVQAVQGYNSLTEVFILADACSNFLVLGNPSVSVAGKGG